MLVVVLLLLQDVDAVLDALMWSDAGPIAVASLLGALTYLLRALRWRRFVLRSPQSI